MLFSAILPLDTFAINNGDTISYRSDHIGTGLVKFEAEIDGSTYGGVCCQVGIQADSSGEATVQKITNERLTKLLYYYGIEKGWYTDNADGTTKVGSHTIKNLLLLSHISQATIQGEDTFIQNGNAWLGASEANYYEDVAEWVTALETPSVDVPDWFKIIKCTVEGAQNFISFPLMPLTGKLKLKKSSANTGITG